MVSGTVALKGWLATECGWLRCGGARRAAALQWVDGGRPRRGGAWLKATADSAVPSGQRVAPPSIGALLSLLAADILAEVCTYVPTYLDPFSITLYRDPHIQ